MAQSRRHGLLYAFLKSLSDYYIPVHILTILEYKLSITLHIASHQIYRPTTMLPPLQHYRLLSAIRSQNIIGWDSFLKGFISKLWRSVYDDICTSYQPTSDHHQTLPWDYSLTTLSISLFKGIWDDCNKFLHGAHRAEKSTILWH